MPTAQLTPRERPIVTSGPITGVVAVALKGPNITSKMAVMFGNTAAANAGTNEPTVRNMGGVFCFHFDGSNEDRTKWVAELKKLEEEGKILPKSIVRVSADEIKFPEGGNFVRYNNF